MKFTLLDANEKELHTADTLSLEDALIEFKKKIGYTGKWGSVQTFYDVAGYHDVKIKDERNRIFYYTLPPKDE